VLRLDRREDVRHYVAQANCALLGQSGMAKMFERDRSANKSNRPP